MLFLTKKPNILIIHPETDLWRGSDTDLLCRCEMFEKKNYKIYINFNKKIFLKIENKNFHNIKMIDLNLKNIVNQCREKSIDLIICSDRSCIEMAKLAKNKLNIKIMLIQHLPVKGFYEFNYKNYLKDIDCILCVNPKIKKDICELNKKLNLNIKIIDFVFPFCEKKTIFDNNLNKKQYFERYFNLKIEENDFIICTIGNMYNNLQHKNYPFLFECIKNINNIKNIKFVIAGDGDKKKYLENLSKIKQLENHVFFLGFVKNIPLLLKNCDLFLLASSEEAFGLSYIEAGAMGLPLVGSKKTGAEFIIIDKVTGFLFENSCEESLINCLNEIINNREILKKIGKNCQNHIISNFSNDILFKKLEIKIKKTLLS